MAKDWTQDETIRMLKKEIERLRGAIITNQSVALDALATHGQLCDEIERLREALRKIANEEEDCFPIQTARDAPKADATISTVARLNKNFGFVEKFHEDLLCELFFYVWYHA